MELALHVVFGLLHVLSRGQSILLSVAKKSLGGDLVAQVSVTKTSVAKLSGYLNNVHR